ncbi:MAG TPA: acetyl-CoA carboxylase carboxyl transferase subunit alpha, partial [Sphingomonadales bacterium]|nr:acetyl-CoA carboxylase carboxyl transferase subunit alpha [Sphingomonadales bacterium]
IYSVISPEGCASILWRTTEKAKEAAHALKITAEDLLALSVIDEIVPEPVGGAHRNPKRAIAAMGDAIDRALHELAEVPGEKLKALRRQKFLSMGTPGAA